MDALLLPGNSKHNEAWVHQLSLELSGCFNNLAVHHYKHWAKDNMMIDIDGEITDAVNEVSGSRDYAIVAKSIGCVLTAKAVSERKLSPSFCVFLGLPLGLINRNISQMSMWLRAVSTNTIVIQNEEDPAGSYEAVQTYIDSLGLSNIKLVKAAGATHNYDDFGLISTVIKDTQSI